MSTRPKSTTGNAQEATGRLAAKARARIRIVALGVGITLAFASCSSGGRSASPTTSTPATTAATDSSHPATTVFGPSGPPADYPAAQPNPPSLIGAYPTGSSVDLVTVVKTLTTYEDWVWSHPAPALVANYELSTGNAYSAEVKNITTFQRQGLHASPTPAEIDWVKVTQPARPQPPTGSGQPRVLAGHQWFVGGIITAVYALKPIPMLTSSGQPSGQSFNPEQTGPTAYVISLVQGPDGQFRIDDITELHPPGGVGSLENGQ